MDGVLEVVGFPREPHPNFLGKVMIICCDDGCGGGHIVHTLDGAAFYVPRSQNAIHRIMWNSGLTSEEQVARLRIVQAA